MLKVLRMLRSTSMTGVIEQRAGRALATVLRTLGLGLLMLHLVAVIFHWVAAIALEDKPHDDDRPERLTWIESAGLTDAPAVERCITPLFCLSHLLVSAMDARHRCPPSPAPVDRA